MLGGVKNSHRSAADRQGASRQSSYFFAPLIFAHLAFWAAAILALPAALILRLDFGAATGAAGLFDEPKILVNLFSSDWILSLMSAARLNCLAERSVIDELISRSIKSFTLKSQQSAVGVHFCDS
jgi:hypothetical protein